MSNIAPLKNAVVPQLSEALQVYEFTQNSQVLASHSTFGSTAPDSGARMSEAAAAAPAAAGVPNLMDLIATDDGKPATPATTNIMVVPKTLLNSDTASKQALFPQVELLTSYCSAAAAALAVKNHPEPTNLTTAAGKFEAMNLVANSNWEIITRGLAGFYNFKSIDTFRHDIHNSSETFHSQFLNTMFKAFLFPESAMAELDAVLTVVNTDLVGFTTSNKSESESLSHLINLTTCEKNAFDIWEAHAHFFLLTIDMGSMHSVWKSGKASHEKTKYSFHMSYLDAHSAMNNQLVIDNTKTIKGYLNKMLHGQLARVEKAVSPKVVVDDSK